jgi:transcriptional regulator with XRE-family HTH domain
LEYITRGQKRQGERRENPQLAQGRNGEFMRGIAEEKSLGERIRRLREKRGLSLEGLSDDTGYPVDLLKAIEEGAVNPPVAVVLQLSRTLKIDIDQVQGARKKEAARRRNKSHMTRVSSYAYLPLSRPGEEKHLRAYRVTLDPETEHKGVEYHHEGEEFIYVLEGGGLIIQVGQNITTLERGGSIHFNSSIHHKLSNPTGQKAELLVVIYVP